MPVASEAENHAPGDLLDNPSASGQQSYAPRSTWDPDALRMIVNLIGYRADENDGPNNVCEMLAIVIQQQFHNRTWISEVTAASVWSTYNSLSATGKTSLRLTNPTWIYFLTSKFCIDYAMAKWQAGLTSRPKRPISACWSPTPATATKR